MISVKAKKGKGRRLQNFVRDKLVEELGLSDVRVAIMGERGADVKVGLAERDLFPFGVECKNTEQLRLWDALAQAESNSEGLMPLLVFKRNRSGVYAVLKFDDFLELVKGVYKK